MSNKWVSNTDVTGCHSQAGELGGRGRRRPEGGGEIAEELKETIRVRKNG